MYLEKIKEAGLEEELSSLVANFVDKGSEEDVNKLYAAIDANGLKSPDVMKMIGNYQRANVLKPGLYKELVAIHAKIGTDGEKPSAAPAPASTDAATASNEAPTAEGELSEEESQQFTEKQEEKIKERMKKEEAKMRERLLKKEAKIRERLANRAEKRAQRLGMKVEEAKEIQEKKEILAKKREEYKKLREEIKVLRTEIKALRPARSKMAEEERNYKVWTRKVARLEKRVEKWSSSDADNAPEKLAKAEEKLAEAKAELVKATAVYEEWKAKQPPEPEKKDKKKSEDDSE